MGYITTHIKSGGVVDKPIVIGDDYTFSLNLKDGSGNVVDVSSDTFTFKVVSKARNTLLSLSGDVSDGANGNFSFTATDTQTSALSAQTALLRITWTSVSDTRTIWASKIDIVNVEREC